MRARTLALLHTANDNTMGSAKKRFGQDRNNMEGRRETSFSRKRDADFRLERVCPIVEMGYASRGSTEAVITPSELREKRRGGHL